MKNGVPSVFVQDELFEVVEGAWPFPARLALVALEGRGPCSSPNSTSRNSSASARPNGAKRSCV